MPACFVFPCGVFNNNSVFLNFQASIIDVIFYFSQVITRISDINKAIVSNIFKYISASNALG